LNLEVKYLDDPAGQAKDLSATVMVMEGLCRIPQGRVEKWSMSRQCDQTTPPQWDVANLF
jgi:hypothetical protein